MLVSSDYYIIVKLLFRIYNYVSRPQQKLINVNFGLYFNICIRKNIYEHDLILH